MITLNQAYPLIGDEQVTLKILEEKVDELLIETAHQQRGEPMVRHRLKMFKDIDGRPIDIRLWGHLAAKYRTQGWRVEIVGEEFIAGAL